MAFGSPGIPRFARDDRRRADYFEQPKPKEVELKNLQVEYQSDFQVLTGNPGSQAAVMVLATGETTGGEENEHPDSDQWLYVVSGEGQATINGKKVALRPGSLVLIEKSEKHAIENNGAGPLETLNFYVPPAY
jgi:mannose-6-phosphate isomerase-like protein (cupin superfamily)